MNNDTPTLGQRIKHFRTQKGLTQQQLELEIGSSPGHVSRIESGQVNPSKDTLVRISQILKLNQKQKDILFGIADNPATMDEFNEVNPYVQDYLNSCKNPAYLADICWFTWTGNKETMNLLGIPSQYHEAFVAETIKRHPHILEWLFNPELPAIAKFPKERIAKIQLYQTIFFLHLINYDERKDEKWVHDLIHKVRLLPNFQNTWTQALKHYNANLPLSREELLVTYITDSNSYTEYFIANTHLNKFPRFMLVEYVPLNKVGAKHGKKIAHPH